MLSNNQVKTVINICFGHPSEQLCEDRVDRGLIIRLLIPVTRFFLCVSEWTLRNFHVSERENRDPLCGIVLLFQCNRLQKGEKIFSSFCFFLSSEEVSNETPSHPEMYVHQVTSTPDSPSCSDYVTSQDVFIFLFQSLFLRGTLFLIVPISDRK